MEEINQYLDQITSMVIDYAPRIILGGLVLFIGLRVVGRISRMLRYTIEKSGISHEVSPFLVSFASVALKVLLLFTIAAILGIDVTSFIAVLAAAGFAVGLALQGSLSNFAAGILILLFRPYKVGEWIEVDEKFGKVEEVQIFNTLIVTPGKKTLIIPNGQVVEGIVTNYSRKGYIRIELNVTMPYNESYPKVREIILNELKAIDKVLTEPAPEIGIEQYDSHSILLAVRPYVIPDHYWEVTFETYERIKRAFHENKIRVAYSEGVEMGHIGE